MSDTTDRPHTTRTLLILGVAALAFALARGPAVEAREFARDEGQLPLPALARGAARDDRFEDELPGPALRPQLIVERLLRDRLGEGDAEEPRVVLAHARSHAFEQRGRFVRPAGRLPFMRDRRRTRLRRRSRLTLSGRRLREGVGSESDD